jgi:hypothetical protein
VPHGQLLPFEASVLLDTAPNGSRRLVLAALLRRRRHLLE